ncbi:MAG: hypothetical protein RQ982_05905, partial [Gammaproteobacteria bacterium]|nr:hypothetical protein [Gammaproteobacteria bacterium]
MGVILITACQGSAKTYSLSSTEDIEYAHQLWKVMEKNRLVGEQAMPLKPFFGGAKPHGMILEVYSHALMMAEHNGFLVL